MIYIREIPRTKQICPQKYVELNIIFFQFTRYKTCACLVEHTAHMLAGIEERQTGNISLNS